MQKIPRGLIVSSQALAGNPMKDPQKLASMAYAAELGGAVAVRANGPENISAMKKLLKVPIVGLNKISDENGTVIITPNFFCAQQIAASGADIIALDATFRSSNIKEELGEMIRRIHAELNLPVLADISSVEEAIAADEAGADYISTTLAGYTIDRPYSPQDRYRPDFKILQRILETKLSAPLIAEGRFWRSEDVERAMRMGVHAVVIGKAVTNPMAISEYFQKAAEAGLGERKESTEDWNPMSADIDQMDTFDVLQCINREDQTIAARVAENIPQICETADVMIERFRTGGRIIYCGAGTSGRLAVADAAECPPTFGVEKNRVIAVMAGGPSAVFEARENCEDDYGEGCKAAELLALTQKDVVLAISANGNANFLLGFLEKAKEAGAETCALVNNYGTSLAAAASHKIEILTGAETIKGSTRMKAGTAQKMVLGMLSTTVFVRCGYVLKNLMVNIYPSNKKLKKRAVAMLCKLTGKDEVFCEKLLADHDWSVRKAFLVYEDDKENYSEI